jgi:hypothetical protein
VVVDSFAGTFRTSTAGGHGGKGGNGGPGGRGGPGGDGGSIILFSISTAPPVVTVCAGGGGGAPGEGGRRGGVGSGGPRGKSTRIHVGQGNWREIAESAAGNSGHPGEPGGSGATAPPSKEGSVAVRTRPVDNEVLAKLASVSQLQMLFESIRGQYLVTEPQRYELLLQSVVKSKDIVAKGRNLVAAAAVGNRLHLRVFDSSGSIALDKPESELAVGERLQALKEKLKALGLRFGPAVEMTPRGVLLAGKWASETAREPSGGWRGALINVLIDNTDVSYHGPVEAVRYYGQLDDGNLAGQVAAIAFLLQSGGYDRPALQRMTPKKQREALIAEIQKRSGRPEIELLSVNNRSLVELGAEWSDAFRRDLRVDNISDGEQRKVIQDVACVLGEPAPGEPGCLSWVRLGERLSWVDGILDMVPNEHPQKPLAKIIRQSFGPC